MIMVKTKDILVRKNQKYEVVIADDNIFVVCPIVYDVEEQSEIVKYDNAEIYANQENINTLEDLKFKVFEDATCKDCVCFDACAAFWYSDYDATNSIEETKKKRENQEVCSAFINKADIFCIPDDTIVYLKDKWLVLNTESKQLSRYCLNYLTKDARRDDTK